MQKKAVFLIALVVISFSLVLSNSLLPEHQGKENQPSEQEFEQAPEKAPEREAQTAPLPEESPPDEQKLTRRERMEEILNVRLETIEEMTEEELIEEFFRVDEEIESLGIERRELEVIPYGQRTPEQHERLEEIEIEQWALTELLDVIRERTPQEKLEEYRLGRLPEQELQPAQNQTLELKQESWQSASLWISLHLPREINEVSYFQYVESTILDYNIEPSGIDFVTDENGNNYTVVYWNEKPSSEIVASVECTISKEMNQNILAGTSPHPYPIPTELISEDLRDYLKPTFFSQSDNPTIITRAEELAEGLEDEAEIVAKTVLWVNQNIEWKCFREIYEEYYDAITEEYGYFTWTALEVLEYRVGVCANFADLTIALLRAQGIPSRFVYGFVTNPSVSNPKEALSGHAWIQVYYPVVGWINYDPTMTTINLPNHIEFTVKANTLSGHGISNGDFVESWYAVGLGNNTFKIKYTVRVLPE